MALTQLPFLSSLWSRSDGDTWEDLNDADFLSLRLRLFSLDLDDMLSQLLESFLGVADPIEDFDRIGDFGGRPF